MYEKCQLYSQNLAVVGNRNKTYCMDCTITAGSNSSTTAVIYAIADKLDTIAKKMGTQNKSQWT